MVKKSSLFKLLLIQNSKWIFCIKNVPIQKRRSITILISVINLNLLDPSILLSYICGEMDIFPFAIENFSFSRYFLKSRKDQSLLAFRYETIDCVYYVGRLQFICQQRVGPYFGLPKSTSIQISNLSKQLDVITS